MNLTEHALFEIDYLHIEDKEKEAYIKNFVKEFMETFGNQGHSGGSAPFAIAGFRSITKDKQFVDGDFKTLIKDPGAITDDPDTWMCNDIYQLVKKYYDLVNTEEFVSYEIDEEWIKDILYRLMSWKPVSVLQGTPDEWYTSEDKGYVIERGVVQNKRYSSIFAEDNHGKNAYNIDGKVFCRNGLWFTNRDSHVPVTFPYEVKDRERVFLEDFVPVEDSPKVYIRYQYEGKIGDTMEYSIGYIKSTLDTSISNPKFHKAEYCILDKCINSPRDIEYLPIEEYRDMPIYRVRMNSRFKEEMKRIIKHQQRNIEGVYEDAACTKPMTV